MAKARRVGQQPNVFSPPAFLSWSSSAHPRFATCTNSDDVHEPFNSFVFWSSGPGDGRDEVPSCEEHAFDGWGASRAVTEEDDVGRRRKKSWRNRLERRNLRDCEGEGRRGASWSVSEKGAERPSSPQKKVEENIDVPTLGIVAGQWREGMLARAEWKWGRKVGEDDEKKDAASSDSLERSGGLSEFRVRASQGEKKKSARESWMVRVRI